MGKFDGFMLCTDLDGTLLSDDESISVRNCEAIECFKKEGGIFTFVTGRAPTSSKHFMEYVKPNVPSVVYNGAGVFDFEKDRLVWGEYLDDRAKEVVSLVKSAIDRVGVVVCTDSHHNVDGRNRFVDSYYKFYEDEEVYVPYTDIEEPWKKVLFITDSDVVDQIRQIIAKSEYAEEFSYMQSSPYYYEILPKGLSKRTAILKICEFEVIKGRKIVCIGDSENDVAMVKNADIGVAPKNALDSVKDAADIVLDVTNNEDAIAKIIYDIL